MQHHEQGAVGTLEEAGLLQDPADNGLGGVSQAYVGGGGRTARLDR